MNIKHSVLRFLKYSIVGVSTFLFDLLLLFLFIDFLSWNYILATGIAFTIAVSINYFISRHFVFKGTQQSIHNGYFAFMGIAGVGIVTAMMCMWLLVGIFHLQYLFSRIIIAGIVGIWNYLMNLYVNFKVAGKH